MAEKGGESIAVAEGFAVLTLKENVGALFSDLQKIQITVLCELGGLDRCVSCGAALVSLN